MRGNMRHRTAGRVAAGEAGGNVTSVVDVLPLLVLIAVLFTAVVVHSLRKYRAVRRFREFPDGDWRTTFHRPPGSTTSSS